MSTKYVRTKDSIMTRADYEFCVASGVEVEVVKEADKVRDLVLVNDLIEDFWGNKRSLKNGDFMFTEETTISSLLRIKSLWIFDDVGRYYKVAESHDRGLTLELV